MVNGPIVPSAPSTSTNWTYRRPAERSTEAVSGTRASWQGSPFPMDMHATGGH